MMSEGILKVKQNNTKMLKVCMFLHCEEVVISAKIFALHSTFPFLQQQTNKQSRKSETLLSPWQLKCGHL